MGIWKRMSTWTYQWSSSKKERNIVCKLKKSIYELKQASRKWYPKFNDTIMSFGFKENIIDQCIYQNVSGNMFIFMILYVDDIFLVTNCLDLLSETKKFLFNNFEIKKYE